MTAASTDILRFYAAIWGEQGYKFNLPIDSLDPTCGLVEISGTEPIEVVAGGGHHTLNLQVACPLLVTQKRGREVSTRLAVPGQVSLVPAGFPLRCVVWPIEGAVSLNVHFTPQWLARVREQEGCPAAEDDLPLELGFWEPALRMSALRLVEAIRAPARQPRLLFDEVYYRLAVGILHVGKRQAPPVAGRLAPLVLREVIEYMHACMGAAVSLEELAALADLSPYHFARSFKASVGVPPHRYLTEMRLEYARARLAGTDEPITTIALSLGFASSSHFSTAFRSHSGVSPSAFRDAVSSSRLTPRPQDFRSCPSGGPV